MHASIRWALPALLILAACDSGPTDSTDDSFALTALSCDVDGVNADPFTVADALADNAADHEAAGDYEYDTGSATTIALAGTSATVTGSGATASGSVVTVTEPRPVRSLSRARRRRVGIRPDDRLNEPHTDARLTPCVRCMA